MVLKWNSKIGTVLENLGKVLVAAHTPSTM